MEDRIMSGNGTGSNRAGWVKTLVGAVAGIFGGAAMMYVSPLVDRIVKPAKPMANFAVEQQGLSVQFHNRSSGGESGWWDFGDGSPLEPFSSQQTTVIHTYTNPGTYIAKLILRNFLGDEHERSVTLQLENPRTEPPSIVGLEAIPVSPGAYAPATFRIVGRTHNTDLCIWDFGDDRPLEISNESLGQQERMVTFNKPGGYLVKMAAVKGKQAVERSEIVYINEPPRGTVTAILHISDQATRVETIETPITLAETFPPNSKEAVHRIDRQIPAQQGFTILEARLEGSLEHGARNLRVAANPDGRSARLTGELVREGNSTNAVIRVTLKQERRTQVSRPVVQMTATMTVPGAALLNLPPLPADWSEPQRLVRLELRDGDRIAWQQAALPRSASVVVQNRPCTLSGVAHGNQVRLDLTEATSTTRGP
jgi:PKD domain